MTDPKLKEIIGRVYGPTQSEHDCFGNYEDKQCAEQIAIEYHEHMAEKYRIALHDAIRRPMGVVPDSAVEFVTTAGLHSAEARRPKHDTGE